MLAPSTSQGATKQVTKQDIMSLPRKLKSVKVQSLWFISTSANYSMVKYSALHSFIMHVYINSERNQCISNNSLVIDCNIAVQLPRAEHFCIFKPCYGSMVLSFAVLFHSHCFIEVVSTCCQQLFSLKRFNHTLPV